MFATQCAEPAYLFPTLPHAPHTHHTDILIVGGGATGLMAALHAAQHTNVILMTRDTLLKSNSSWAQGGIAAALDEHDSPASHIEDTLAAGAGLSDYDAAELLAYQAPQLMHELADLGVPFEHHDGKFALGLEGSHSHRRILHVGDATGFAITNTLVQAVRRSPRIRLFEGFQAIDLVRQHGQCTGLLALDTDGSFHHVSAKATILATGGAGALYHITSNQPTAMGEGIALAYRAGAEVADMEFVQFHPTVFRTKSGQGFLISEATRGEGGTLYSPNGERFMVTRHPLAELAPRDIVTRGIFAAMQREACDHVLLDLTHLSPSYLATRFPTITVRCREEGIDPATQRIPVAPAAHYLMGGIRTSLEGETSVPGLYAAGECACTGIHGANRLASNSLLECLVFGQKAATAALDTLSSYRGYRSHIPMPILRAPLNAHSNAEKFPNDTLNHRTLTDIMCSYAGPLRSADDLQEGLNRLDAFPRRLSHCTSDGITLANATLVARLIITSALIREESRGAHFRTDFPETQDAWRVHTVLQRFSAPKQVERVAESPQTCPLVEAVGIAV